MGSGPTKSGVGGWTISRRSPAAAAAKEVVFGPHRTCGQEQRGAQAERGERDEAVRPRGPHGDPASFDESEPHRHDGQPDDGDARGQREQRQVLVGKIETRADYRHLGVRIDARHRGDAMDQEDAPLQDADRDRQQAEAEERGRWPERFLRRGARVTRELEPGQPERQRHQQNRRGAGNGVQLSTDPGVERRNLVVHGAGPEGGEHRLPGGVDAEPG